jgi:DNA adenine methylase
MTCFHGGKQRIGKKLAQVICNESLDIENEYNFTIKGYCEPFCGMLGVYRHIPDLFNEQKPKLQYKAGDANKSVVAMWKAAQKGWKPPNSTTTAEYSKLKYDKQVSALKGFIGHQYSFGGQFFQGFIGKYGKKKSSVVSAKRVVDISKETKNVTFSPGNYTQFSPLKNFVIYCDPPYAKFSQYYDEHQKKIPFSHGQFWGWCRKMSKNNIVFVSEYTAPKDFKPIFKMKHSSNIRGGRGGNRIDKIYIHESWL